MDKEAADKHLSRYCRLSGAIMNKNGFKGRLRLTNAYMVIYAASGGRFQLPTGKCPALKAAKSTVVFIGRHRLANVYIINWQTVLIRPRPPKHERGGTKQPKRDNTPTLGAQVDL